MGRRRGGRGRRQGQLGMACAPGQGQRAQHCVLQRKGSSLDLKTDASAGLRKGFAGPAAVRRAPLGRAGRKRTEGTGGFPSPYTMGEKGGGLVYKRARLPSGLGAHSPKGMNGGTWRGLAAFRRPPPTHAFLGNQKAHTGVCAFFIIGPLGPPRRPHGEAEAARFTLPARSEWDGHKALRRELHLGAEADGQKQRLRLGKPVGQGSGAVRVRAEDDGRAPLAEAL